TGTENCAKIFDAYRETYAKTFGSQPHPDRLAYSAFAFVGDTDEEALRESLKIQDFLLQSFRAPKGALDVPGYYKPEVRAKILKAEAENPGSVLSLDRTGRTDPRKLVQSGVAFYGNPDSVFEQLKSFFHAVGGFGNLLPMAHGSDMSYALTTKSMRLF